MSALEKTGQSYPLVQPLKVTLSGRGWASLRPLLALTSSPASPTPLFPEWGAGGSGFTHVASPLFALCPTPWSLP